MSNQRYPNRNGNSDGTQPQNRNKKRKKGFFEVFFRSFAYTLFIVGVSLLLSVFLINVANDALALIKTGDTVRVELEKDMSTSEIAKMLKEKGLIKYEFAFELFAKLTKSEGKFKYGKYDLDGSMGYYEIVNALKRKSVIRDTVWVTIPEGAELKDILKTLEAKGVCSAKKLQETLDTYEFDYDFLKDLPDRPNKFEGYLFPDTYEFYVSQSLTNGAEENDEDPVAVLKKFFDNFEIRVNETIRQKAEENALTLDELITLASIVEREAGSEDEMPIVASVFHNRMSSKKYPYLQSCATVQYILQERKPVLSIEDTKIESPYNTYINKGLPVGPIASPGLAAIMAAADPDDTDYYFFSVDASGKTIFAKTYEEHLKNVKNAASSRGAGTVVE